AMVRQVLDRFGAIDILVNSAGRNVLKSIVDHTVDDWDKVLNTNLRSCFLSCRAVGPHMIQRRRGKIINIASTASVYGVPNFISYVASKAGLAGFTRALATEWGPYGINVNAIAPSYTETDFTRNYLQSEENVKEILVRTPLRRVAQPDDLIGAALYLASPASDYVTGHTLFVDGGWTIA
ncbi:MAG: SDR family oxidoreductase, partial [Chloroflexi bacterium]|nr:SDR family oxidoreductase [Chloroflexota bacterium]